MLTGTLRCPLVCVFSLAISKGHAHRDPLRASQTELPRVQVAPEAGSLVVGILHDSQSSHQLHLSARLARDHPDLAEPLCLEVLARQLDNESGECMLCSQLCMWSTTLLVWQPASGGLGRPLPCSRCHQAASSRGASRQHAPCPKDGQIDRRAPGSAWCLLIASSTPASLRSRIPARRPRGAALPLPLAGPHPAGGAMGGPDC